MTLTTDSRPRHPENAHKPDNPIQRKPAWIRVKAPTSATYHETRKIIRENNLPDEVLRLLDGMQTDEMCPCNRAVGGATL